MQPKLNPRSGVTSRLSFIYSSYCKGTLHVHGFISFLQRFNPRGSADYPNMDARNEYQIMPSFFFCYKTKFAIVMSVLNMKDFSNGFSVNQLSIPKRKQIPTCFYRCLLMCAFSQQMLVEHFPLSDPRLNLTRNSGQQCKN